MIRVRAARLEDAAAIHCQPGQQAEDALFDPMQISMGPSFAIEGEDGRLLFVGGLAAEFPHVATCWAFFAEGLGREYRAVVRAMAAVIGECRYGRVQTLVRDDWARAHALARLLGFEKEGVLRRFGAGGEDFAMYARVKQGDS